MSGTHGTHSQGIPEGAATLKASGINVIDMPPMRRVRHIHFVGIGGAGMCGIAEVLIHQGYEVTGSDLVESSVTERLARLGAAVRIGHKALHVDGADVLVVSSAIGDANVETQEAHLRRIPVVSRASMLGELMRHRYGIAIAGTHGKTTATSLIASIFQCAGLDPTYVIGGLLKSEGSNARLGLSRYFIAEADESDASFLFLNPMMAVITNIDRDHLGTYSHHYQGLLNAFKEFIHKLPFYGLVVLCIDDMGTRSIIDDIPRPMLTYGLSEDAEIRAVDIVHSGSKCRFRAIRPGSLPPLEVETCLPGDENTRNVLAAVAVATDEGIDDEFIVDGLANFSGIDRRFDVCGVQIGDCQITMIDDYGHHPTEVRHIVNTVSQIFPGRRLVMVYQPHRFTRTRDLFDEFVEVLSTVDLLILVDTYAASEDAICGASGRDLAEAIQATGQVPVHFAGVPQQAVEIVSRVTQQNDVLAIQGAGSIDQVSEQLRAFVQ